MQNTRGRPNACPFVFCRARPEGTPASVASSGAATWLLRVGPGPHEPLNSAPRAPRLLRVGPGPHEQLNVRPTSHETDRAQGRNRTADTGIFNPLLYQLSYLGLFREGAQCRIAGHGVKWEFSRSRCCLAASTRPRLPHRVKSLKTRRVVTRAKPFDAHRGSILSAREPPRHGADASPRTSPDSRPSRARSPGSRAFTAPTARCRCRSVRGATMQTRCSLLRAAYKDRSPMRNATSLWNGLPGIPWRARTMAHRCIMHRNFSRALMALTRHATHSLA